MKRTKPCPGRLADDPLRWAIAAVLLTPAGAFASGIVPVPGPNAAQVVQHGGTPEVLIPAPNAHGVSHGQFDAYNVGHAGAVLNNALQAGQSQLLGELNANPQLGGVAASTILNEVVGSGASRINGPQEIFGQAANYILANPNGIQVNGGRLINAPHSAFLVGVPELENGRLTGLNTFGQRNTLAVEGAGLTSDGALDLIAPRVNVSGDMELPGALTVITGQNRVNFDDGQMLETRQAGGETTIDTHLLGGMRAGRIRVVSTAEGAGVRMASAGFIAAGGVQVASAGGLAIGDSTHKTRIAATQGEIRLQARDDLTIDNTRIAGHSIHGEAGNNVQVRPGSRSSRSTETPEDWESTFLGVVTERKITSRTTAREQHSASVLTAGDSLTLKAGKHLELQGADLRAEGHASLQAGGDITLDAAVDRTRIEESTYHRKHMWKSKHDSSSQAERVVPSRLNANTLSIESAGATTVRGSEITTQGDMAITAGTLKVESKATLQRGTSHETSGDLLGGLVNKRQLNRDGSETVQVGSNLEAGGKLTVKAGNVQLTGSRVHGAQGATLVSENGAIVSEASHNLKQENTRNSDSTAWGLVGSANSSDKHATTAAATEVSSQSNLRLEAATDINLQGTKVEASGTAEVLASGDINMAPAVNEQRETGDEHRRGFTASAGQTQTAEDNKTDSKQYQAQVGYQVQNTHTESTEQSLSRTQVNAANVRVEAGATVQLTATDVVAREGDATLKGERIELLAHTTEHRNTTDTATYEGGIGVQGGMDRTGSESYGRYQGENTQHSRTHAEVSTVTSNGNLRLEAGHGKGTLVNQGSQLVGKGDAVLVAGNIDNQAANSTEQRVTQRTQAGGSAGLNVETQYLTRPIEKFVNGVDQTVAAKGVEEALEAPSLGIDLKGTYGSRTQQENSSHATVTRIEGGAVKVLTPGELRDEGTRYTATQGTVGIEAGSHHALAAHNSSGNSVQRLDVEGALRADTVTTADINGRALGVGGSFNQQQHTRTAVPASIEGRQGVQIQLGTDGRYEGTRFDGGGGMVVVKAAGDLNVVQANNSESSVTTSTNGFAWAKAGTSTAKAQNLGGGGNLVHDTLRSTTTTAVNPNVQGKGAMFKANGDFTSEGLEAGTVAKPLDVLSVDAGGKAQLLASRNTASKDGERLGGTLVGSLSKAATGVGGGLGGHIDVGRTHERVAEENLSALHTQRLSVRGEAVGDGAVTLGGVIAKADTIDLTAPNGSVVLNAATRSETRDNLGVLGAGSVALSGGGGNGTSLGGVHGRLKVSVDNLDSTTHRTSELVTSTFKVNSGGDVVLNGARVKAGRVEGTVEGDLRVNTLLDRVKGTEVALDARLSKEDNPQGLLNAARSFSGPFGQKVEDRIGKDVQKMDFKHSPGVSLDVARTDRTTAAQPSELLGRQGVDLRVQGDTYLSGAKVISTQGAVSLGEGEVHSTALAGRDYRAEVHINASNSPTELADGLIRELTGKPGAEMSADEHFNAGVLRVGGHDRTQQLDAGVIQKPR